MSAAWKGARSVLLLAASTVLVLLVVSSCDLAPAQGGYAAAFTPAYQVLP